MFKLPKEYRDWEILARRVILFALGVGLIVVYMPQILGFISKAVWICLPFIIGGFLAFVLVIFQRVLMKFGKYTLRQQNPEKYLIVYKIVTLVIVVGFIALMIAFIIPQLISSLESIAAELPGYLDKLVDKAYTCSEKYPWLKELLDENQDILTDLPGLISRLASFLFAGSAGSSIENLQVILNSTFSWIWIIFLSIAFSLIAFFNAHSFQEEANLICKAYLPEKIYNSASRLLNMVASIFTQYIGGTVLECIILATLVSVFGLLFRIPYAILCGVFCGICALVPMFGATAGAIICTLVMLMESPGKAVTFLIMFICIQQVEGNFIYPNVVGKSVGLPPMFVIVSITIGASIAGILGMVISIPVASVIYALILDKARRKAGLDGSGSAESADSNPNP